jgi:5-methylcytosine-specific restriction endonuclease McrA
MKLCPECLKKYKRSKIGKSERSFNGLWGRGKWPIDLYHDEITRKCLKHHVNALARGSERRSLLIKAMPSWANKEAINNIYRDCFLLTKKTGIKHEVDHIVPLRGKNVTGFHVEYNLRIITATENRRKNNKF